MVNLTAANGIRIGLSIAGCVSSRGRPISFTLRFRPEKGCLDVTVDDGKNRVTCRDLGFRATGWGVPLWIGFGADLQGVKDKKSGVKLSYEIDNVAWSFEPVVVAHRSVKPMKIESRFKNFITRSGDQLFDGNKLYRFLGANVPGLILPYDYWLGIEERMVLPNQWEVSDAFKTARQMGLGCLRTWNLPIRAPGPEKSPVAIRLRTWRVQRGRVYPPRSAFGDGQ